MAVWLRVLVFAEDMSSVPGISARRLTTTVNSSSRGSNTLFYRYMHMYTHPHTCTHRGERERGEVG